MHVEQAIKIFFFFSHLLLFKIMVKENREIFAKVLLVLD